jgi:hypothetical protein
VPVELWQLCVDALAGVLGIACMLLTFPLSPLHFHSTQGVDQGADLVCLDCVCAGSVGVRACCVMMQQPLHPS